MDMVTYENDLDFLTQLSYRLNDLSMYDPIKDIALPMIQQYSLAPYAHFTHYDLTQRTLRISHIQAESTILNTIIAYTGKKIFSTLTPVDEKGYELISSSGISFLNSLTDLSFGAIPPILDKALKKLTGFSVFCAIPQIDQGDLYGTTILAFRNKQALPHRTFLKSYSSILSLALRKKQSEEKLSEKETMLQHLTDSMGEVFWIRKKDKKQIYFINHAYEKIWGRPCQTLKEEPDSFLEAVHPDDKIKVIEAYGDFQHPYGIKLEYRIIRPDNDLRWINARSYPVRDQKNNTYAYAGFAIDITEQKKSELLLMEYAKTQEFLLELTNRYINIKPDEINQAVHNALAELGSFLAVDRAYIFSYDWEKRECSNTYEWCAQDITPMLQELQGLPFALAPDIVDAHSRGTFFLLENLDELNPQNPMKDFFQQQGIKSMISIPFVQGDRCSGFIGFDSVKKAQTYSEKEKKLLKLFAEIIENVLEKTKLTEKMECEASKFNKIFYANPALMAISDLSNQRYLDVNDTFLSTLGFSRDEVIGKTPDELRIIVFPQQARNAANELLKSGKIRNIEMTIRTKSGDHLSGLFSGDLVESEGKKIFVSVMVDITAQKRMESLKQQLIEKLSHEFRTPLSSLKQAFGIMKMQVLAVEPDLCQVLDRNILRLESLLDKIIDFNALNKENISLLRTKTRLSDLLMEVKGKSLQLNPTLTITIDDRDPEMSPYLDQVMIKKVLEEIIQNAVIHGQADHILIETSSSPNYDKILISDNGRGIPEEDVSKVFDPFYQSKEEYQTKRGRAGLGLPVAKRIIESHGGSISIQSPQNKGTIVSITFYKASCM